MNGERVELIPQPGGFQLLKPGQYGKWTDGTWYASAPNGHGANLASHDVIEHSDGTITVSPSIEISDHRGVVYHGYLEAGVWRDA